jgi:hypothetical protein
MVSFLPRHGESPLQENVRQGVRIARDAGHPVRRQQCDDVLGSGGPDQVQTLGEHPQTGTGDVDLPAPAPREAAHGVQQIAVHRHPNEVAAESMRFSRRSRSTLA